MDFWAGWADRRELAAVVAPLANSRRNLQARTPALRATGPAEIFVFDARFIGVNFAVIAGEFQPIDL